MCCRKHCNIVMLNDCCFESKKESKVKTINKNRLLSVFISICNLKKISVVVDISRKTCKERSHRLISWVPPAAVSLFSDFSADRKNDSENVNK